MSKLLKGQKVMYKGSKHEVIEDLGDYEVIGYEHAILLKSKTYINSCIYVERKDLKVIQNSLFDF